VARKSAVEERIFRLDPRIRYCSILDGMGAVVSGGMRPGVKSLNSDAEEKKLVFQITVTSRMAETARLSLGKADLIIIRRKKVMLISIPTRSGGTVLVATEPDFPLRKVEVLGKVIHSRAG